MNTLRLQLRFLVPLILVLVGAAYLASDLLDKLTTRWFMRDLNLRGSLIAGTMTDAIQDGLAERRGGRLEAVFERALKDERLFAIALCGADPTPMRRTATFPRTLMCEELLKVSQQPDPRIGWQGGPLHVGLHEIPLAGGEKVSLVLLQDVSYAELRSRDTRRWLVAFITALGMVVALITVVVAQLSWRGWVSGARALLRGEGLLRPIGDTAPELEPFVKELRENLRELEDGLRLAQAQQGAWDPARLRALLQTQLRGDQVIVVSNREPYIHEKSADGVVVKRPASGLVTAVEPVMRACSGTWIAHGSGSADRQVVDRHDRVRVPPGADEYALRRVWLTPEEEQGYYYGFANEGMWPLCHVAHVRPVFRESDWEQYRAINERFADAVAQEARGEDPVVLVQDYHFALLPAMIRKRLPRATVLTFWHIPWPNPESFGICPWRTEILEGMLGSTILGFHTPYHCKNFIETVDRMLEARIEHEHSTISLGGAETLVAAFPISIEWPGDTAVAHWPSVQDCRQAVIRRLDLPADARIAVGVDRFDYTKGILERFHAVERLLEKRPEWIGRFVFVQVAAPTRSALEEYQAFQERIQRVTERINTRFGRAGYQPIRLLATHHEHEALNELFRAADACVVTSLHDGMNLVCKEFVAARNDERGVLILSRFAGAAGELREALIVNPYHVEETADALHHALVMPEAEQRERMVSLRMSVREHNVFLWAGRMLADAGRLRLRERIRARVERHGGVLGPVQQGGVRRVK
ncbi:MAG TPA: trehalose-6-phosphate synthase [Ramlibacter sp.]|nr:trehalose-6-phosphate synthase [Ramlibacter sp.]